MIFLDVLSHVGVEPSAHHPSTLNGLANLCGADVEEGRFDHLYSRGKGGFVDGASRSSVDEDWEVSDDFVGVVPTGESLPVVGADDERELMVGMSFLEFAQRGDGVGRQRETALEIGHPHPVDATGRQLRHC